MLNRQSRISRNQIVTYVASRGEIVSARQIVRWHQNGLLPRPTRVFLGRGKGTVSTYPIAARTQAVVIARALRDVRSFREVSWTAWVEGLPVTARVRDEMVAALGRRLTHSEEMLDAGDALSAHDGPEHEEQRVEDAVAAKELSYLRGLRRRVPRGFESTAARVFAEIETDRFSVDNHEGIDLSWLTFPRRRYRRLRRQFEGKPVEPWIRQMHTVCSAARARDAIARLSDAQLEVDREIARHIWELLAPTPREPMPAGLFLMVIAAKRANPMGRLGLAWIKREVRAQGYDSLSGWAKQCLSPLVQGDRASNAILLKALE